MCLRQAPLDKETRVILPPQFLLQVQLRRALSILARNLRRQGSWCAHTIPIKRRRATVQITTPAPAHPSSSRTRVPTYEKSGSACDSRVVLLRGVQVMSAILSSRLCFCSVSCRFSPRYGSFLVSMTCMIASILRATATTALLEPCFCSIRW